tara:strand:+ start:636 stop:842 length:207 start_codon:yes stop_codon:yes gene_type:complete
MSAINCPECEKELTFDYSTRKYFCKNCGIFVNRDEIVKLREKRQDEKYKEKEESRRDNDYLQWWLSKK